MDPALEDFLLRIAPIALGSLGTLVASAMAHGLVTDTLKRTGLSSLEAGVRWTVLLARLAAVFVLVFGAGWVAGDERIGTALFTAAFWIGSAIPGIAVLAGAGWYTNARRASARPDEDVDLECRWVHLIAGGVAAVSVTSLGGLSIVLIALAVFAAYVATNPVLRGQISLALRRWSAGNTLRTSLLDGDTVVMDGRTLSVIGSAGLLSTDLLGDHGLQSVPNDELLVAIRALPVAPAD